MPRRKYSRKRRNPGRGRRYRRGMRGRKRGNASTAIVKTPSSLPDRLFVKLNYCETIARAPGATVDKYIWRGNGLFDPNSALGGHQPYGYDQWMGANTFYNKYRVHASKIKLKAVNTFDAPIFVALIPTLDTTAYTTIDHVGESPYAQVKALGLTTNARSIAYFKAFMTTKKIFGLKTIVPNDNLAADYLHDPGQQFYWMVYAQSGTVANLTYTLQVKITYYVELYTRTVLLQS